MHQVPTAAVFGHFSYIRSKSDVCLQSPVHGPPQIDIGAILWPFDSFGLWSQVSTGEEWRPHEHVRRTPIVVTGNDFSRMFAPLIRDGRMTKFYWKPSRDDLVNILWTMYAVC